MDLIGTTVRHTVFGTGVITEQIGNYITVQFSEKTTKFVCPDAFNKYLKAEDAEIQALIMKGIEEAKVAAAQRRQEEEATRKAAEEQRSAALKVAPRKTQKPKSIDEMFSEDYHAEKLARQPVFTYQQVEDQFGIKISGFGRGINPTDATVILISSIGKSSGKFVYHDKWTTDGEYLYSGEGKTGDQAMTKGNLAIKNAARDGKQIHLFVKFSPQEYYYQGIFELIDYTYEEEKDEGGNARKEYKFRLKKVVSE